MFYICIIGNPRKIENVKFGMAKNVITKKENIKMSEGIATVLNVVDVNSSRFDIKPFIDNSSEFQQSVLHQFQHICFVVRSNIFEQFISNNKSNLANISDLKIVNSGMIEKNFKVFININTVKLNDVQIEIQKQEGRGTEVNFNCKDVCYNFDFFNDNYNRMSTEKFNTLSLSVNSPSNNTPKFVNLMHNINQHGDRTNIVFVKKYNVQKDDITCRFLEQYFKATENIKVYTNSVELFSEYSTNPIIHFYNIGDHIPSIVNLFIPQDDMSRSSELTPYFYLYYYDDDDQDNHVYKSVYSAIKNKMEFTKNFFTEIEN